MDPDSHENKNNKYNGFTLIEILVVVGLIAILAAITIIALNPSKMFANSRNVERWNEIRALQSAVEQWIINGNAVNTLTEGDSSPIADCGTANTSIMDQPTVADGQVYLTNLLVSEFIVEIPRDPSYASGDDTGYRICKLSDPVRFLISAPGAELTEIIEIPTMGANVFLAEDLLAYLKFNEDSWNGTAGEVIDSTLAGNNGTAVGNATTASGLFANSGTFDGSGDYLNFGDQPEFDLTLPFTISLWMKLDQIPSVKGIEEALVTKYSGSGSRQYVLEIGTNDDLYFYKSRNGTNGQYVVYSYFVSAADVGVWRHVVVTADSNGVTKLYVDNEVIMTNTMNYTQMANTGAPFQIGRRNASPYFYLDGMLDDVRLYSKALTVKEVNLLYQFSPAD